MTETTGYCNPILKEKNNSTGGQQECLPRQKSVGFLVYLLHSSSDCTFFFLFSIILPCSSLILFFYLSSPPFFYNITIIFLLPPLYRGKEDKPNGRCKETIYMAQICFSSSFLFSISGKGEIFLQHRTLQSCVLGTYITQPVFFFFLFFFSVSLLFYLFFSDSCMIHDGESLKTNETSLLLSHILPTTYHHSA